MTTSSDVPDKEELQRQQLHLANEKMKLEMHKLELDSKPEKWWIKLARNVVAVGGIVTVAASAYGIWDSYNKTIVAQRQAQEADQRARFEESIKRLESPSTISKLVGVSVLSGYLERPGERLHRQILFTLASLMATEKDFQTQTAVVDLITSIPGEGPITKAEWIYFQELLTSQSRALMEKADLSSARHYHSEFPVSDDERSARTIGKLIAAVARKAVVPNFANYRGIYCTDCDFRGVAFPRGADFTDAVLDGANFRGASLEAASFDNAEIAGSNFVEADLRQARFRSPEPTQSFNAWTPYIEHIALALDLKGSVTFKMPNFACANLEGASFERHSLFPGVARIKRVYKNDGSIKPWHRNLPDFVKEMLESGAEAKFEAAVVTPPKFFKANLKNDQFGKSGLFFSVSDQDFLHSFMDAYRYKRIAELQLNQGSMGSAAFENKAASFEKPADGTDKQDRHAFQRDLRASFFSAQLEGTSLPDEVTEFLKKSVPTQKDYDHVFSGFPSQRADPDLNCRPRYNS